MTKPMPLPAVISNGKLPVPSDLARLTENLRLLSPAVEIAVCGLTEELYFEWLESASTGDLPWGEGALAAVELALPALDEMRQQWREFDRPATVDEIAKEVLKLVTTLPQAGNVNQQILSDTLCQDITDAHPTAWELVSACTYHRRNTEFLSVPKLLQEIRHAKKQSARHRNLLAQDFVARIPQLENPVTERRALRKADAKGRKILD